MVATKPLAVTERSRLRRKRERGSYDRTVVDAILDEALVCHVGVVVGGQPTVIPMAYARAGDVLYLHGAAANATLQTLAVGEPACVTVTLLDGLVLSRAAKHHSVNFRTVVLFGRARLVDDPAEKVSAVGAVVEHAVPGRMADVRPPTDAELRSTMVVAFPVDEGSAKIRTGGPVEDPEDLSMSVWAGEVPLRLVSEAAVADDAVLPGVTAPSYLAQARFAPA